MITSLVAAALLAGAPTVAFTISDDRIVEASGLAPGLRSPGVVYVQNDSGDTNRVFAINARTGATAATIRIPGATNVDWEDLAVATDSSGTPSIWVADTGDNDAVRDEVRLYRVDEPRLDPTADDRAVTTDRPDEWRLRYPDGSADVESLAVAPGGQAYLVTKSFTGSSDVYRVPGTPSAVRVQQASRVGQIGFGLTGTPGGPNAIGQLTATGAALSRDGERFVLRTYTDAYLWSVRDGDLAGALRSKPVRVALPEQPQGEGIAVVAGRLLVDSEGADQPVYSVPLPAGRATTPAATTPAATTPAATSSATSASESVAPSEPDEGDRSGSDNSRYVVGGAVVIVLGLIVVVVSRRRR